MLGHLLNEYPVDMFSSVEDNRLSYIGNNQDQRIAVRSEINETVQAEGGYRTGRVYLPSTFMGSPRMQRKLVADGLAIVRRYGKPTYFMTATCNPNWSEIRDHPGMDGQNASDRPDITCRVFFRRSWMYFDMGCWDVRCICFVSWSSRIEAYPMLTLPSR